MRPLVVLSGGKCTGKSLFLRALENALGQRAVVDFNNANGVLWGFRNFDVLETNVGVAHCPPAVAILLFQRKDGPPAPDNAAKVPVYRITTSMDVLQTLSGDVKRERACLCHPCHPSQASAVLRAVLPGAK